MRVCSQRGKRDKFYLNVFFFLREDRRRRHSEYFNSIPIFDNSFSRKCDDIYIKAIYSPLSLVLKNCCPVKLVKD